MQTLHNKKNELQEVEFFKDKECTIPFDFTNAKNLYIELKNGDCTPLNYLPSDTRVFTPYIPHTTYDKISYLYENRNICIQTIDDITPNLSKYILESSDVLFLSEEDVKQKEFLFYYDLHHDKIRNCGWVGRNTKFDYMNWFNLSRKKLTIFLSHGTQSKLQKTNEIAKELKEKYGVEEVNLMVLHWFYQDGVTLYKLADLCNKMEKAITQNEVKEPVKMYSFNKIITTNSTGILEPQNTERLQVIDCKEIFEEYLKTKR